MKLTVGELKEELSAWEDDTEIHFEGLEFYRFKRRGEKLLAIEFNAKEEGEPLCPACMTSMPWKGQI